MMQAALLLDANALSSFEMWWVVVEHCYSYRSEDRRDGHSFHPNRDVYARQHLSTMKRYWDRISRRELIVYRWTRSVFPTKRNPVIDDVIFEGGNFGSNHITYACCVRVCIECASGDSGTPLSSPHYFKGHLEEIIVLMVARLSLLSLVSDRSSLVERTIRHALTFDSFLIDSLLNE